MKKLFTFSLLLLFVIPIFGQDLQYVFSTLSGRPQIINQRVTGGTDGLYYRRIGFVGNAENNGLGKYVADAEFSIKPINIPANSIISIDVMWPFQIAPGITLSLIALNSSGIQVTSKTISVGNNSSNWTTVSLDPVPNIVTELRVIISSSQQISTFFASVEFGLDFLRYNLPSQSPVVVYSFENDGVTAVESIGSIPTAFKLEQNYPNPFNPTTTIRFYTPSAGHVSLKVYDINGKEIATLTDQYVPAGNSLVEIDASNLASGIYFYRLRAGSFTQTKKMILMK